MVLFFWGRESNGRSRTTSFLPGVPALLIGLWLVEIFETIRGTHRVLRMTMWELVPSNVGQAIENQIWVDAMKPTTLSKSLFMVSISMMTVTSSGVLTFLR